MEDGLLNTNASQQTEQSHTDYPPQRGGQSVLVTGGAGLVGRTLIDTLVPDNDVRVLDHFETTDPSELPADVEIVEGDVRDDDCLAEATDGVDVVFHQAATSISHSTEHPTESHAINERATLDLLEHVRREDARLVLASSAAIYGPAERSPIDETHRKAPMTPYGVQKLAADEYARLYHDLYGVETVVLRYFNVYGKRHPNSKRSSVVNVFLEQALDGTDLTIEGTGRQRRDFVHVRDVVRANLLAATTPHVGEAYNVGTGTPTSIRDLASEVLDVVGSDADVVHTDARDASVEESLADVSKARDAFGYDPTVSIRDGLEAMLDE
ncbi:NAD-dependent epimerase/dehydratase family protein [Halobium palmae]|uniref:NAD-dependent epimerase/dehydratase family protein n=1 Tax=Halobium palmae TaxID=1776492 RepID=A0ABD5RWG7_9EURY